MKNQLGKILLTLPVILILVAFEAGNISNSLKLAQNESGKQITHTQAQVNLKSQFGWGYYARRKGRTEECTWLGINCN